MKKAIELHFNLETKAEACYFQSRKKTPLIPNAQEVALPLT